jgi:NNP family nitrate/nitrite transporter-like MFS transporter
MDIQTPGEGVMAGRSGTVTSVSDSQIVVEGESYTLRVAPDLNTTTRDDQMLTLPTSTFWHKPVVQVGDEIERRQLLAKGVTHIYFQANVWIFTGIIIVAGTMMGIGKAAVYRHITDYFPNDVGVAGGMVGVLGGLGGFFGPVIFGYLLKGTGIWTTSWMFLVLVSGVCLVWMHLSIQNGHQMNRLSGRGPVRGLPGKTC